MTECCFPAPFTKVYFQAATGIVRDWRPGPSSKPIGGVTSSHRAKPSVIMEVGYIIIDQGWGRRPQEKIKKLNDNRMKKLKKRFKRKK